MDDMALIDTYVRSKESLGRRFALPPRDAWLEPVVESCAYRLENFQKFARRVRDMAMEVHGEQSHQYIAAQEFVRKLDIRAAQRRRRQRLQAAHAWAKQTMPERSTEDCQRWLRALEKDWAAQRLERLKTARRRAGGVLPEPEVAEVVEQFWRDLDNKIHAGKLPSWDELMET